jgi:succinate-semialdehyde dehydrogenase/glutarate-semialdehyde dehydrogenase
MLWINPSAVPSAKMPFGGVKDSGYGTEVTKTVTS